MKPKWIAATGSVIVIVGSALPWVTTKSFLFGELSVGGLERDGIFTLPLGIVVLILALATQGESSKTLRAVSGLLSLVAGVIGLIDLVDANRVLGGTSADFLGGSVSIGIGLYLVVVGAGVAIVGSWLWYRDSNSIKKAKEFVTPPPSRKPISGRPTHWTLPRVTHSSVQESAKPTPGKPAQWICPECETLNAPNRLTCQQCGALNPKKQ
jgi:hypothetical protein